MMECNKEEALKAKELAEKRFHENDIDGAWRMAFKAHSIFPGLDGIAQMVASLRVLVAAKVAIGEEKDWYAVLSVDPSSDLDVVKKQYRRLALSLHPDKNKSVGADAAFKLVSEACNVLSDKIRREAFDYKRKLWASQQRKDLKLYSRFGASQTDTHKGALSNRKAQMNTSTSAAHVDNSGDDSITVWFSCRRCMIKCEYFRTDVNQSLRCPRCFIPFLAAASGTFGERAPPSDSIDTQQQHKQQHKETAKKDRERVTSIKAEDLSSIVGVEYACATDSSKEMRQGSPDNAKSQSDPSKIVGAGPCSSSIDFPPFGKIKDEREKVRGESRSQAEKTDGMERHVSDKSAGESSVTSGAQRHKQSCGPASLHPDKQPTVVDKTEGYVLKDVTVASEAPPSNSSYYGTSLGQDQQLAADAKMKSLHEDNSNSDCTNKSKDIVTDKEAPPSNSSSDGTTISQDKAAVDDKIKSSDESSRSGSNYTNKSEDGIFADEVSPSNSSFDGAAPGQNQQSADDVNRKITEESHNFCSDHTIKLEDIIKAKEAATSNSSYNGIAPGQEQQPAAYDGMKHTDETNRSSSDHANKTEDIVINTKEAPPSISSCNGTAPSHDQQPAADGKMKSSNQSNRICSDHTNKSENVVIDEEAPPSNSGSDGTAPGQDQQPAADNKMKSSDGSNRCSSDNPNKSEDIVNTQGTAPSGPGFRDLRKKKKYRLLSKLLELTASSADATELLVGKNKLKKVSSKIGGTAASSTSRCCSHNESNLNRTRSSRPVKLDSKQKPTPGLVNNGSKGGETPIVPTPIPDSDFYDFDRDRSETSFSEGQVWAAYDDDDGMPRFYVLIQEVLSLAPFKIRMAFLTSCPTSEFGDAVNWAQTRFASGCGDFQTKLYEFRDDCLAMFSHETYCQELPERGSRGFRIIPCKGDVWVLYKNWSPDWGRRRKRQDVACEYEVVQVVEEYNKERGGMMVVPLVKVRGYTTVFCRCKEQGCLRLLPGEEMVRFSHRVPAKMLTWKEDEGALEGCLELDPAAMPLVLLHEEGESPAAKSTGYKKGNAGNVSCPLPCTSVLLDQNKRQKMVPSDCK